jgi:hypothetical protein
MTKFYEYRQNNSGGSFDIDDAAGIGVRVWIEATDSDHADSRAETIYQSDRVIRNAYMFMHEVCKNVGFVDYEDEDAVDD